jgi:hypothetical protein
MTTRCLTTLLVLILGGLCSRPAIAANATTSGEHFPDHFIVGIHDLDEGIRLVEQMTGVRPIPGGVHPHIGTHNALIALGDRSYLEIIAPDPGADLDALVPELKKRFRDPLTEMARLTPFLWAIGSRDIEATAARLRDGGIELSPPQPGSRKKPDGSLLEWRASFIVDPAAPGLPFVIQWKDPAVSPPTDSPQGCRIVSYSVFGPNGDLLAQIIEALALDGDTATAEASALELVMDCPAGRVTLGR